MRRALIVGINDYSWSPLKGCVNDANNMARILNRHYNGDPNFHCQVLTSEKNKIVTQTAFRKQLKSLFNREGDMALLYFAGHGEENELGGHLVTQDANEYNEGIPIREIITMATNAHKVGEIFIILDCCYSGQIGSTSMMNSGVSVLRKGISILTASQADEKSSERNGQGIFTRTVVSGLNGAAADVLGNVTAASLYSYVDKILGPWQQRPVFKSHVNKMSTLRKCTPTVTVEKIRKVVDYFKDVDSPFPLDPSHEYTSPSPNPDNVAKFKELQKLNSAGLVEPNEEEYMYYAAMKSESCSLTELGKTYWTMVKNGKI